MAKIRGRKLRTVPLSYRPLGRPVIRMYGRFYALYENITGKMRRASYQVRINPRADRRTQSRMIRTIVNRMLSNEIPVHKAGQVFGYFELMKETPWIKIRKLLKYRAGAHYER